jgi:hypothetical protein
VADWEDVRRAATALPEVTEATSYGMPAWQVRKKTFLWERPLRRQDVEELGDAAPAGPVLGARVPDLGVKAALIADDPEVYFTTSHFDGYPAVLVRLEVLDVADLAELATEAWLARAPTRLARQFLESRGR